MLCFYTPLQAKEPNAGCLHHLSRLMEKINKNIPSLPPLFPFLLGAFIWYTSFQCQRISWFMALYDWNQFGLTCFFLCIVLLFVALLVDTYLNMDKQLYSNLLWILNILIYWIIRYFVETWMVAFISHGWRYLKVSWLWNEINPR